MRRHDANPRRNRARDGGFERHRDGHREEPRGGELVAALDKQRRAEREVRFLEAVVRSSPRPEVVWDMDEVKRSLDDLVATGLPGRSVNVVRRILSQTTDAETRALCERALQNLRLASE